MINQLGDDVDAYTLREGEFCCNAIVGFNFGDGHLHDADDRSCAEALSLRSGRAHRGVGGVRGAGFRPPDYLVIDPAMGVVERGSWAVKDAVEEQPWLPNGPIPTVVTYRKPGYERVTHTPQVAEKALVMV
jgi:hypothetical protein